MNDVNSLNRAGLLQTLNLAKPALASQPFVPILTHFCFDGAWVLAYNDVQAIGVRYSAGVECSVPGDLLIKLVGSLQAETITLESAAEHLLLSSGRSSLKLPTLPAHQFTFDFPADEPIGSIDANSDFIRGIEKCLTSAGSDPTHPAQMGVTVEMSKGGTLLYSTDNVTVCRYRSTADADLLDDDSIILPTFFCQQLVQACKAFVGEDVVIDLYPGAVVAQVGEDVKLFSKLVLDVKPLRFDAIFDRFGVDAASEQWVTIPPGIDAALSRCLAILSTSQDKTTKFEVRTRSLELSSQSQLGESSDGFVLDKDLPDLEFHVDPQLVDRGIAVTTHMALLPTVLVLGDESMTFTHLIAHHALV